MEELARGLSSMLARSLPQVLIFHPLAWFIGSRPRNYLRLGGYWLAALLAWPCVALFAPPPAENALYALFLTVLCATLATFGLNSFWSSRREPVRLHLVVVFSAWIVLAVLAGLAFVTTQL